MAEPITWQALEAVRDRLAQIRIDAGYHTDLGAGRLLLEAEQVPERQPATLIDGGQVQTIDDKSSARRTTSELSITIEFAQPITTTGSGSNAKRQAHRARADIIRALNLPWRGETTGIGALRVTGSQIMQSESGAAAVIAQVTARAVLSEAH